MAGRAGRTIVNGFTQLEGFIAAADRLKHLNFFNGMVRRIDLRAEPAAILVEIERAPVEQQEQQHDQPDRKSCSASLRFTGTGGFRFGWMRGRTHFAVELVAAAAAGAAATLKGASNSGAPERRLNR